MTEDDNKLKLLENILFPADLKKLKRDELPQLCDELRQFIIDACSQNPGHLGASLGVVELTVALHYVFDTPDDILIWDVGHQAYGHKILTGRRELFHTNRKYKGISGFPKMSESPYDAFGTGHASTSISAAIGIAVADRLRGVDRNVVAIIGDGSMTGGLAFEGLNNAGIEKTNLLVILNDNNMAIDPNTGALKEYLADITTSRTYNRFKNEIWNMFGKISRIAPNAREYARKLENGIKSMLMHQSNLFEAFNFRYFGPIDGHDVRHLADLLYDMKNIKGPKLLHIHTIKGKGYRHAEQDQTAFHAPGRFDKESGVILHMDQEDKEPPLFQDVFGKTVLELARQNERIVAITPAMTTGCGLKYMMEEMPDRTFDVGIAEQHAVTFSAGLASQGLIPFCSIYSSFMQRAFDQVIHDVALQNLPVVLCVDRGGLVGADGPTHHGVFDMAYLRNIPNLIVMAPMDEEELRNMMYTAQLGKTGPVSIRYPKGRGVMVDWKKPFRELEIGKGRLIRRGSDIALLTVGYAGNLAVQASQILKAEYGIDAEHWDMRFVKPLDVECLHDVLERFRHVITVEDGVISGGFGSAVAEYICDHGFKTRLHRLGVPDQFIEQGTQAELYKECGFDVAGIVNLVRTLVKPQVLFRTG